MASTLSDETAPSASLDHLEAQTTPTHPRAKPEPLGSSPRLQELASGRPKVELVVAFDHQVLKLGNVTFKEQGDATAIVDTAVLEDVAQILKFDAKAMGRALTTRRIKAGGEWIESPAAGLNWPPPCLRTAPHLPPWTV